FNSVMAVVQSQPVQYNAFHPGELWKDNNGVHINAHGGGMLFYNKTYYWFGEHKIAGKIGNTAQVGVHCYASKDLYNWNDEGIALKVVNDTTSDIQKGCTLERPKVVYNKKTQKFVMWFHIEKKGKGYAYARVGVAVANKPTGPYTYLKSIRSSAGHWPVNVLTLHKLPVSDYVKKTYFPGGGFPGDIDSLNIVGKFFAEGQMSRDMNIFLDDDGRAYHIYASEYNATLQIAELTDDYLAHTGKYVRAFAGRFMEAPAMFKRNGLYYLIMSGTTGWNPNPARAAVSPSIWGPWTETGNPCLDADSATTYHSQSTYILPVAGKKNAFIFMADRWNADNPVDGRYVWLPIEFEEDRLVLKWYKQWSLSLFNK
ncbi:MAG: glycoside hydrolase family 43 protein, partial [Ferruginibacter sp.]